MDMISYLKRIKVKKTNQIDLFFLTRLQEGHLLNIYFENIDIIRGKSLSLNVEKQYQKIIENDRGGVCFELNGLFHHLLKQLDYQVQMISATVYNPDGSTTTTIENTHLTNLVHLEKQTYLVDVGFGGNSPRKPIPLNGEEIEVIDGRYRINQDGHFYQLEKKENTNWQPLYRFELKAKTMDDFIDKCKMIETSAHSPFNKGYFLTKVIQDGRITLTDHTLTVVENGVKRKQKIKPAQMPEFIKKYFRISVRQDQ